MDLLARVLPGDLKFGYLVRLRHAPAKRMGRLAHLEVHGTVLDLKNNIAVELAVKGSG